MPAKPRKSKTALYYAINDAPAYLYLAEQSIRSMRRFDQSIPVYLFIFGKPPKKTLAFARSHKVTVRKMKSVRAEQYTFLKWLALPALQEYERVMFLDADTYFFAGAGKMFSRYRERDFYARREAGANTHGTAEVLLGRVVETAVNHAIFDRIAKKLGIQKLPVFNTGVMIFNHFSHRQIASQLQLFEQFQKAFKSGRMVYPSRNPHIVDEICLALVLGHIKDLKWGLIRKEDSPWYAEWKGREVDKPGVVLHTWSQFCHSFYLDFFGERGLNALLKHMKWLNWL